MFAPGSSEHIGRSIHVDGVVQGVGFRPFVYTLAFRFGLRGWVRNSSAGVDIRVEGSEAALTAFLAALRAEAPPLARIDRIDVQPCAADGFDDFSIVESLPEAGAFAPIPADMSLCPDCQRELLDPADRRFRYPFINCTNCGPRFTIIRELPYDRPLTTMAGFEMCPACAAEYHDPLNRRFHAQPLACPDCGPQVWLCLPGGVEVARGEAALRAVGAALRAGQIVAIKGLGGFHLACDARSEQAVQTLRQRKHRPSKPFALMLGDLSCIEAVAELNDEERALISSQERPIVLVDRRPNAGLAPSVAPGTTSLGVMLPYTPLHMLLFSEDHIPLVMTSGNLAEEPICTENGDALEKLRGIADLFLLHDRPIYVPCDDSVVRAAPVSPCPEGEELAVRAAPLFIRRARGFAPGPVRLPFDLPPLLAAGPHLKNTFCLASGHYAFPSQHIGDLENFETLQAFEGSVKHFEALYQIRPGLLACDLHPDYLSTRYAQQRADREGLPLIRVQHHHAHIAACLAENDHPGDRPVIGLAFDGTGYGPDEAIWGGEILVADYASYRRACHLSYLPLPGGDAATRHVARIGYAWLREAGVEPRNLPPALALKESARKVLVQQIEKRINSPLTSSMGRLFDAFASIAGVAQIASYEGQAAIELEAAFDPAESGAYDFPITGPRIDALPAVRKAAADIKAGKSAGLISARVHRGLAQMSLEACRALRASEGLGEVALSGGVWQNRTLLRLTLDLLTGDGFRVYTHRSLPPNDGGVSLGQALIAAHQSL